MTATLYSLRVLRVENAFWPPKPYRSKVPSLYVRVALGDVVRKTGIVSGNLSPEWNEIMSFSSSDDSSNLNFQIKHHSSVFCDSCIACVDVSLSDLLQKCANGQAQFELQIPPQKRKTTVAQRHAGVLYVHLQVSDERANAANELEGVGQAIVRSDFTHTSRVADTSAAIFMVEQQLSGESDLRDSLEVLCEKLGVFVNVMDAVSTIHPFVTVAWQLASGLYKAVSSQFEADKKVIKLAQAMNEAFKFADDTDALIEKAQSLRDAVDALLKQTCECCIFIQAYIGRGFTERMLDSSGKAKIDEFTQAIATLKRNIESGTNLSAVLISSRISERVDALFLRDRLDPQQSDAFSRPQCLAGTRAEIRKEILAWMFSESDQNVFWLYGVAGSGKSTVSTTVANHLSGVSRRGAFLFFERGKSEPNYVIRTIAYELAMFDSSIGKAVIAAVEQDNNVAMTSAENQFDRLLLQPLTAASLAMQGPVIVVLDALDECGTPETRRNLMKVIGKCFPKLPKNFRFLITSRPEDDIRKALLSQDISTASLEYMSKTSREDVLSYLHVEMHRIVIEESEVPLPADWPWEENMKRLGKAAGGLFIWAATAVKLVSLRRDNPFQKLKELVENYQSLSLHELYATVLTSALSWEDPSSKSRFREVLSVILFSKRLLTVATIDGLLNYPPESSSRFLLSGLRSVVDYSPDGPVRLFHSSFSDYLVAPERSSDPWFMEVPVQKTYVAMRCFEVMKKSLNFNICELQSSYIRNDAVPDLKSRVKSEIRPYLFYASLFWAQHLREASLSSELMVQLTDFLYRRLLYWLEVLSLSKCLGRYHSILSDAIVWTPTDRTDVLTFLRDAINLVTLFFEGISRATAHLYISLLPLAPASSKVAAHYLRYTSQLVHVMKIGRERTPPLLKTLMGHYSAISSVAFSPDGTHIASASSDRAICMWDANSGAVMARAGPFEGHTDSVLSISFSPDGRRLASGSSDHTVRVWDAVSGEVAAGPFEGHAGAVWSVSFSPDGSRLASGSHDTTIRVWDAGSGQAVAGPFRGHTAAVLSILFSPDGTRLASGSLDNTVRVWDASSGDIAAGPFEGHTAAVWSVSYSPDGTRLASGSLDTTVRVWNAVSGEVVAGPFQEHTASVSSVSFSPDGTRLASGSHDHTVRVWDAVSGEVVTGPFEGHTDSVTSVSFSSDGTRLASGSEDKTVRVWDAVNGEVVAGPFEGHTASVLSVSYSPDGRRIASGSSDNTVRVWDAVSGAAIAGQFEGHTAAVMSVSFSPDGTRLASGSEDKTVRVWDGVRGQIIAGPFEGHTDSVKSVSFSPDGRRLASGSHDSTVRVWDAASGEIIAGPFQWHTELVMSVSYSPDGTRVASETHDLIYGMWDTVSSEIVAGPFEGRTGWIPSVSFSPDGTRLASGSDDNTVWVWDAVSGEVIAGRFERHTDSVTSVSFSPDGRHLASGSDDGTARVWDAVNGEAVAGPFRGHKRGVTSVSFSPDGTRVATGSRDHTIRVWDVGSAMAYNEAVPSLQSPSFSNWSVDESGWVKSGDDILLWIPPFLRDKLFLPQNSLILSCPFYVKLDFAGSAIGSDWQKCFNLV